MDIRTDLSKNPPSRPSGVSAQRRRRIWPWFLVGFLILGGLVALRLPGKPAGFPGGPGGIPGGPSGQAVQSVGLANVTKGNVPITLTSLGTVTSLATVTIKSQISGYLTSIAFREGEVVKKGDLLAQVDPRPYEALLAQYEGQLEKDQALLDNARIDLARYRTLVKQDSISKQTADTAAATVRQYEGMVRSDQAQVDAEKLNLSYCRITSPVEGRVGLRQVDVGNYVTSSDANGIVVVVQNAPISVVFTLPEDNIRPLMKRLQSGAKLGVTAYDRASSEKLAEGVLDSIDSQIDTTTGTVKLRALFENADGALFPNQFVNVSLLLDTLRDVAVVPTRAVQTGTPGTFVYKLNPDNTVSLRKITTGQSANGLVAVFSGVSVGEQVVVDGVDHLSDGAKVTVAGAGGGKGKIASPATQPSSP